MKIDYIEFKNFASYGNKKQRIDFQEDQSEFFLTLGKNGDGKTTIANAIVFALYGKVDGVKMSDLPNRINKNLEVKIGLWCNSTYVEIERGLAPSKFEVLINGVEFDKAGKRSVQDYLEEELFGIPYHVFKNIIILSINDFKSFLTMTRADKKQIIDRMFGFSILNDMQQMIKNEKKELGHLIDQHESELSQIMENISSVKYKLNTLIEESNEKDQDRIQEIKDQLLGQNSEYKQLEMDLDTLRSKIQNAETVQQTKRDLASKYKYEIESLQEKLKLYEDGVCPTCDTKLDSDWHFEKKEEFKTRISNNTTALKKIKGDVDLIKQKIESAKKKRVQISDSISSIRHHMESLKKELISIKKSEGDDRFEHLNNLIDEFEQKEEQKSEQLDKHSAEHSFLETMESLLGEDGVKNLAVKTILPGLNANIAEMTQTMHLSFQIRFDNKFDCVINHLGEVVNPMTLSTGERKKADFIVIIAIIKILKLRFPQLNLLFLDELLSSVDSDGVYNILNILKKIIRENNMNAFIINHTQLPREIFDREIHIYRENGFSKFDIVKID